MKTKQLVWWNPFARWQSRRRGKALNLLNWDCTKDANRSPVYWMSLLVAILAHGALLTYLVGFAHMPDGGAFDPPRLIAVEIADPDGIVAAKSDREDLGEPEQPVAAAEAPQPVTGASAIGLAGQLPEDRGAAGRNATSAAWGLIAREGALPEDGPSGQDGPHGENAARLPVATTALPEDVAAQIPEAAAPKISMDRDSGADAESSASRIAQKIVAMRDMPALPSAPPSQPEANQQDTIIVDGGQMTALLPDDAVKLPASGASRVKPSRLHIASIHSGGAADSGEPQKAATGLSVPVPTRKLASAADLLLNDETGSAPPAVVRHKRPAHRADRKLAAAYLAKVRAHLAEHKPVGGLGSGTVVVSFILSRSGAVTAAGIVRSSGKIALDDSVLDAVRLAAPFPKPPENLSSSQLRFAIPFRFE